MGKQIAIIPARRDSQGFKFKNRKFFDITADFIDQSSLFDEVIVSTNDDVIKEYASARNYTIHHRSEELSAGDVSIKQVFTNFVDELSLEDSSRLWLFYLPVLYKQIDDFTAAMELANKEQFKSLMSFVLSDIHPYSCWKKDGEGVTQYISNDVFRRQDMPEAWRHYHYLCCLKASEVANVNHELIGEHTRPIFLSNNTRDNLIEIDTPEDYEKWKSKNF